MAFIDYYKILGVDKTIERCKESIPETCEAVPSRSASRRSEGAGEEAKFQALQEAYDVIGDPEKRRKYDQYGEQWKQAEQFQGFGGGAGGGNPFGGFDFSQFTSGSGGGFSDFFESLFGRKGRQGGGFGGFQGFQCDHRPLYGSFRR